VAGEDIDMIVVEGRCGDHKSMGMESRSSDGSRAVAQEARVGLEIGNWEASVDVEDFDPVLLCSTAFVS
jgi:hypothetical protein